MTNTLHLQSHHLPLQQWTSVGSNQGRFQTQVSALSWDSNPMEDVDTWSGRSQDLNRKNRTIPQNLKYEKFMENNLSCYCWNFKYLFFLQGVPKRRKQSKHSLHHKKVQFSGNSKVHSDQNLGTFDYLYQSSKILLFKSHLNTLLFQLNIGQFWSF